MRGGHDLPALRLRRHRAGWAGLALCVVWLALAGCAFVARDLGYAGAHPGYVRCSGKGTVTMTSPMGGGTLMAECSGPKDGPFIFEQGRKTP